MDDEVDFAPLLDFLRRVPAHADFLSWVIEATAPDFSPSRCAAWLEGRLPRPVDDAARWTAEDPGD